MAEVKGSGWCCMPLLPPVSSSSSFFFFFFRGPFSRGPLSRTRASECPDRSQVLFFLALLSSLSIYISNTHTNIYIYNFQRTERTREGYGGREGEREVGGDAGGDGEDTKERR